MSGWIEGERAPILPPALQAFLKRRGAELTGLAFLIAGLGALLALVSYHPADPSFSTRRMTPRRTGLARLAPFSLIRCFRLLASPPGACRLRSLSGRSG